MEQEQNWREQDLENWLVEHRADLGDPLLFIQNHSPIKHMVDLLAIDHEQRLVLIEVKNERATRAAMGQVIEYLSEIAHVSLEDLEEDYRLEHKGKELKQDYASLFGCGLSVLSPKRRVIIIGPTFDHAADTAATFLTTVLPDVQFSLKCASWREKRFFFEPYTSPPRQNASSLPLRTIAEGKGGRVYVVLSAFPLVLWRVGRFNDRGTLMLASSKALKESLITRDLLVGNLNHLVDIDLDLSGTTWSRRAGLATLQARVLGAVQSRIKKGHSIAKNVIYARFENERFTGFRKIGLATFSRTWERSDTMPLPTWDQIAALAAGAQLVPGKEQLVPA